VQQYGVLAHARRDTSEHARDFGMLRVADPCEHLSGRPV
jgi:hypothetical protein